MQLGQSLYSKETTVREKLVRRGAGCDGDDGCGDE